MTCENLPRQKVVLDSETLQFKVKAEDDFGVKRIGMEWQGVERAVVKTPAKGERILAAGGNDKESLEIAGTFTAKSLGIEPQPLNVRMFTEDYLPGRGRVYSPTYLLYVLSAEQHAIWLTEQLSKWHRQSLEVRDREMQLYQTNKQLRSLSPEELDRPEVRRRIEDQSAAERTNGRRLASLVGTGEELVQQAMRNPEFGVGHLEKWAEMLQILKDIAANRMPNVADLLKQASQSPRRAATPARQESDGRNGPRHAIRLAAGGASDAKKAPAAVPQVVDRESSQQPPDKNAGQQDAAKPRASLDWAFPRPRWPARTAMASNPAHRAEAGRSRRQTAGPARRVREDRRRVQPRAGEPGRQHAGQAAESRIAEAVKHRRPDHRPSARRIRLGHERRRRREGHRRTGGARGERKPRRLEDHGRHAGVFRAPPVQRFKTVFDEMRKHDVVGNLRQLGDDLRKETECRSPSANTGPIRSTAGPKTWSIRVLRQCRAKSRSSLPPSIVLEAMLDPGG